MPLSPPDVPASKDYCLIPTLKPDFLEKIYVPPVEQQKEIES
jgi:hypothetical protein